MNTWNFKVNSNVQEIIKKLDATLGSADGFVFKIDHEKNDSVRFKVSKRGLYAFNLMFVNKIIVNGKILKTNTDQESNIEISFTQYFLWKLIIIAHIFLGLGLLAVIVLGLNDHPYMYIAGGILLIMGIVLLIAVKRKFERDIQQYKTLISGILGS